jgi:putative SOS response-associated peptidase YedK
VAVIGNKPNGQGRGLVLMKWGFVPHWAGDQSGPKPKNAKSETVLENGMFREPFRKRRCLIPATGFYE